MTERLFNISELSVLTGISRITLRKRIEAGGISSLTDQNNKRKLVPLSEVLRVFPDVTADKIDLISAKKMKSQPSLEKVVSDGESGRILELEDLLKEKDYQIRNQQMIISMLQKQVEMLENDKAMLIRQLDTKDEQMQMFGRLITERSSAKKISQPPRDSQGRFVGKGVSALLDKA